MNQNNWNGWKKFITVYKVYMVQIVMMDKNGSSEFWTVQKGSKWLKILQDVSYRMKIV